MPRHDAFAKVAHKVKRFIYKDKFIHIIILNSRHACPEAH